MEYDHIVVGGGSAGCVLARRLSDDPAVSVLLLEAGGRGGGLWEDVPLGVGRLLNQVGRTWCDTTEPAAGTGEVAMPWLSGLGLGGSSAVNGMLFVRGHPARYDEVAAKGWEGWDYRSCLPAFKRMEDFPQSDSVNRGRGGPLGVTRVEADPISDAFLEACTAEGLGHVTDYNDAPPDGSSYLQLSTRRGWRCSAARAYLGDAFARPNLTVLTGARALRILFSQRRAYAVQYRVDHYGIVSIARAKREVILCAGAVRTPALLERSGVGDAHRLESLGIEVVANNPQVGENLQDHFMPRLCFETSEKGTVNHFLNSITNQVAEVVKFVFTRRGILANASLKATAFVRSDPDLSVPDLRLQIGLMSAEKRIPTSDVQLARTRAERNGLDPQSSFHIGVYGLYPTARGSTHIRTADIATGSRIQSNYLSTKYDRTVVVAGLRIAGRLATREPLRRIIRRQIRPDATGAISDADLLDYARKTGHTCWHPIGTCRMGSDKSAVVDLQCKVNGVESLRVVDASVFPEMVTSNTNAPTLMLAERVAGMIRNDAEPSRS